MSVNSVNNRTNINNYILLKRTQQTEKIANNLETAVDELFAKLNIISQNVDLLELEQSLQTSTLSHYLSSTNMTMEVTIFCNVLNSASAVNGTYTINADVEIYRSDNTKFTPLINQHINTYAFGSDTGSVKVNFNDLSYMFDGNTIVTEVDFTYFVVTNSNSLVANYMFRGCKSMTKLVIHKQLLKSILSDSLSGIRYESGIITGDDDTLLMVVLTWNVAYGCLVVEGGVA